MSSSVMPVVPITCATPASAADAAKADAGVSGVTAPFASLASSLPRQNPSRRLVVAASEQESLDNLPVEMDSAPTALVE
jgi:hypothetical protein